MSEDTIHLAIGVADAASAGVKELKEKAHQKGVHCLEDGGHLFLYPINQELSDILNEIGLDLDPDKVRLSLDWVNTSDNTVRESDLSTKIADVDFYNKTFQLFDLPTIFTFIDTSSDVIEDDKKAIWDIDDSQPEQNESDDEPENQEEEEEPENKFEDVPDSFVDDEPEAEEQTTEPSSNENNEEAEYENDDAYSKDDLNRLFEDEEGENEEDQESESVSDNDPLFQAAINIFNKKTLGDELPAVDSKTRELINSDLTEATDHVESARQNTIADIYFHLKNSKDKELAEAKTKELAKAKKEHDQNIDQLKKNNEIKLKSIKSKATDEYNKKREKAGQAALQAFYTQYDSEHLPELNDIISHKSEPVRAELDSQIQDENKSFADYNEKVQQAIFNHVIDHTDVDSEIEGYRKVVGDEKKRLFDVIKAAKTEQDKLRKEVEDLRRSRAIEHETSESRVQAQIAQGVNEKLHDYRVQVDDADRLKRQAEIEAQQWREKYDKQQENITKLLDKVSDLTVQYSQARYQQNPSYAPTPSQPQMPQAQSDVTQPKHGRASEFGNFKKYIGIAAAILVSMSLSSMFTAFAVNSHQPAQPTAAVQSHESTDQTSNTEDNTNTKQQSENSSTPETFTYTSKNGRKYTVIKDDNYSGHYVDDNGKSHTVLFK